jgi:glucose-1-phosphate thymidylyltransferase
MSSRTEIVGLVPAGGHATRISPLPCSKELFPVGWRHDSAGNPKPKVVSHYLLDKYTSAGIRKAYFILRNGKWDIPQYYGHGEMLGMDLAYLIMNHPHGHPFTIDQAYPFVKDNMIAFGYPDILFEPNDAFTMLIDRQVQTGANVVLGVFPIRQDQRWDICSFGAGARMDVVAVPDPPAGLQRLGWAIAVWTPAFTAFMHEFLSEALRQHKFIAADGKEYVMNHLFQAAIDQKLSVDHVIFDTGFVRDIGTPVELMAAQAEMAERTKDWGFKTN